MRHPLVLHLSFFTVLWGYALIKSLSVSKDFFTKSRNLSQILAYMYIALKQINLMGNIYSRSLIYTMGYCHLNRTLNKVCKNNDLYLQSNIYSIKWRLKVLKILWILMYIVVQNYLSYTFVRWIDKKAHSCWLPWKKEFQKSFFLMQNFI